VSGDLIVFPISSGSIWLVFQASVDLGRDEIIRSVAHTAFSNRDRRRQQSRSTCAFHAWFRIASWRAFSDPRIAIQGCSCIFPDLRLSGEASRGSILLHVVATVAIAEIAGDIPNTASIGYNPNRRRAIVPQLWTNGIMFVDIFVLP